MVATQLPADWRLLCVGCDDGIGAALAAQAAALGLAGHIAFLGVRDDVPALLAAADMALLCSHQEGFPNAVLEAQSAGLAMVVTDAGGTREAVVDAETAIVVPVGDTAALGTAIVRLATEPGLRARMGAAARARIEREFRLEVAVDAYDRLYARLADGRAGP